jgi:folate-binding protein YgfZ
MEYAHLTRYGLLSVSGSDARAFLHAQLTNDIENLPPSRAALAGWCSAKGRLLASFLVIPTAQGFLLQLSRDLVPTVVKRLSMFVLRSKVKIADESGKWHQLGVWGDGVPGLEVPRDPLDVAEKGSVLAVRAGEARFLVLSQDPRLFADAAAVAESRWTLDEIRAGRPLISAATQDHFVPQMVNFDTLGAVSFQKGCYPGQEIVARAQYRGQVKRRMKLLQAPPGVELRPGEKFEGGTVVDVAPAENGSALLVVMPVEETA